MKPATSGPLYLAIDQGGHASRARVHDATGRLLTEGRRKVALLRREDGRLEYDPGAMLDSLRGAIADAVAMLGKARRRLRSAGLATQRSNCICWDRSSGDTLSPLISWQDRRAAGELGAALEQAPEVRRITGLAPSAHYGASKLRWCLDHLPAVRAALDAGRLAWGPMASFLLHHLLHERPTLCDPVNAARTLLWDLDRGDWSDRMLEIFDLPRTPLPAGAANRHTFGTLGPAVSGAGMQLPLCIVTGDQNAALHAQGPPREDTLYVTIGTGAFVLRATGTRRPTTDRLLAGLLHDDGRARTYAVEGTVNGAGSALEWLAARANGEDLVERLHDWLAAPEEPPLFINAVSGLGTPYMVADLAPRFEGTDGAGIGAQAVAVVESMVFLLQVNIEEIARCCPLAAGRIHVGGGLSRYDGLCRRLADLSGLPVWRSPVADTTALGLARLLAACDGHELPGEDPLEAPGEVFIPAADERLRARYGRWCAAMDDALSARGSDR